MNRALQRRAVPITFVVAVGRNGVIGADGGLPWRVPSDLKVFRRLTMGKPVIMGRKTFASIGKPLPGRSNIVVSRQPSLIIPGADVVADVDEALDRARAIADASGADEIAVIGGATIYAALRDRADIIYLTRIDAAPDGDASFVEPDDAAWAITAREPIPPDPRDEYGATLLTYRRR